MPAGDWVDELRRRCDRTSQMDVARQLGVSAALINQVLKGAYKGDLARIESRVKGEFLRAVVQCPVLGKISTRVCQDKSSDPFATTNTLRVHIWEACRTCPNNQRRATK